MMFLRRLLLTVLLLASFSGACSAETLFDRSLALFEAKAAKVSKDDYSFVVLGDSRDGDAVFKKVLKLAKAYDPLFILHGGDYSGSGTEEETAAFLSLVRENIPDLPIFVVIGNHETPTVFAREIGPSYFTLKSARLGLTLTAVDNSEYKLRRQDLDYISRQLSYAARTKFVAMHVPPKTSRWSWHTFSDGAEQLEDVLLRKRPAGIFFSHVHLYDSDEFGGVPAFITGGAGGPLIPFGFPGDARYHFLLVRVKNGKPMFMKVLVPEKP